MADREVGYTGVSRLAWGYFFLYVDINLGPVSALPDFVGYVLFLSGIGLLQEERRDLALLRPLGILLAVWHTALWGGDWLALSLAAELPILALIAGLAELYFHFQLLTDCAALARRYQGPGDGLDQRLLWWRTVQTLLLTAANLLAVLPQSTLRDTAVVVLAVVLLIACVCLMRALFALRRVFLPQSEEE